MLDLFQVYSARLGAGVVVLVMPRCKTFLAMWHVVQSPQGKMIIMYVIHPQIGSQCLPHPSLHGHNNVARECTDSIPGVSGAGAGLSPLTNPSVPLLQDWRMECGKIPASQWAALTPPGQHDPQLQHHSDPLQFPYPVKPIAKPRLWNCFSIWTEFRPHL